MNNEFPEQQEQESQDEPQPVIADEGIGLSLEEVRQLLAMKHEMIVGVDDPILMMVTLHNAFLSQQEKLYAKYEKAFSRFMEAETEKHLVELRKVEQQLGDMSASVIKYLSKNFIEESQSVTSAFKIARRDLFWFSGVCAVSALVNVAVFVWRAL